MSRNVTDRKEIEKRTKGIISRMNTILYGFDTSQLPPKEAKAAEEVADRRRVLEEKIRKREDYYRKTELSQEEVLRNRLDSLYEAKIKKVTKGAPLKWQTNEQLEEVLEIMRLYVRASGVK